MSINSTKNFTSSSINSMMRKWDLVGRSLDEWGQIILEAEELLTSAARRIQLPLEEAPRFLFYNKEAKAIMADAARAKRYHDIHGIIYATGRCKALYVVVITQLLPYVRDEYTRTRLLHLRRVLYNA